jgi:NTP pyrophosphatase (non-canonical NTP hydrolase)
MTGKTYTLNQRRLVKEFRDKHGLDKDSDQFNILVEEVGELGEAIARGNEEDILDECVDVIYVARLLSTIYQEDSSTPFGVRYRRTANENLEKDISKDGNKVTKDGSGE